MTIKLYIDYVSQPSKTVLCFCILNDIPTEIHHIRIPKNDHQSQSYGKINPARKVPAIVDTDNDFKLGESHAILLYLIRKYKLQPKWYPENDIKFMSKVDQYFNYHHQNTRKLGFLVYAQMFSKLYTIDSAKVLNKQSLHQDAIKILTFIESYYFNNTDYMISNNLTVIDISAFFQIDYLDLLDLNFDKYPKIKKWIVRMKENSGVQKSNEFYEKYKDKIKMLRSAKL